MNITVATFNTFENNFIDFFKAKTRWVIIYIPLSFPFPQFCISSMRKFCWFYLLYSPYVITVSIAASELAELNPRWLKHPLSWPTYMYCCSTQAINRILSTCLRVWTRTRHCSKLHWLHPHQNLICNQ